MSSSSPRILPPVLDSNGQDEQLSPPRPFFTIEDGSRSFENEDPAFSPSTAPSKESKSTLRLRDRQKSAVSLDTSPPTSPQDSVSHVSNPFSTPAHEQVNPFSPPASVVEFSVHGDQAPVGFASGVVGGAVIGGQHFPFPELHQRVSAVSSVQASWVDLRHSRTASTAAGVRDTFTSPPRLPLAILQPHAAVTDTGVLAKRSMRPRPRSTMLSLSDPIQKPWLTSKNPTARLAYFLTYSMMFLGVIAGTLQIYFSWKAVPLLGRQCLVLDEQFEGDQLDTEGVWLREADMGGFGNGEFEMTTVSTNNSFIRNNNLYLLPTLTSDAIGQDAIYDGYTFNLTGCTNTNLTACSAVSNRTAGTIINPVMSARLSTKGKKSIRYGRVEVRAKLPRGDWLWPAIWMLPENNTYGPWPLSGEIDIMEARGNGIDYPFQGINVVRGSLNWGPLTWLNAVSKTYGWWAERRSNYNQAFHTYALEWSEEFMRIYVDNRLQHLLYLKFDIPFFERGDFPAAVSNASQEIILANPWAASGNSAPFDQSFYLILDVAVGGTNGWWPDGAGKKPWLNGALNAMEQFALAQDQWYPTWPADDDDRAMIVDYVKMWELC